MWYIIIIQSLWLILPAYIANASAVIVGGGLPIDRGRIYKDGRRVLGDGKTYRGLFVGTLLGMIAGFCLVIAAYYINNTEYNYLGLNDFGRYPLMIPLIFSLCFGALMGDIIESFFKRRLGKERGENWVPFDQIDFLLGSLALSFFSSSFVNLIGLTQYNWFLESFTLWHILFLILITPFMHILANLIHAKRKKVHRR
ncbi:MAG: CDP-2,3-bis-(O-geranylgeranyl)-sn-glycerol synthase [Candidatus Thermoplasmatota archaeon]